MSFDAQGSVQDISEITELVSFWTVPSGGPGLQDDGDGPVRRLKSFLTNRGTSRDVRNSVLCSAVGGGITYRAARTFGTFLWTREMQHSAVVKNRDSQGSNPT